MDFQTAPVQSELERVQAEEKRLNRYSAQMDTDWLRKNVSDTYISIDETRTHWFDLLTVLQFDIGPACVCARNTVRNTSGIGVYSVGIHGPYDTALWRSNFKKQVAAHVECDEVCQKLKYACDKVLGQAVKGDFGSDAQQLMAKTTFGDLVRTVLLPARLQTMKVDMRMEMESRLVVVFAYLSSENCATQLT